MSAPARMTAAEYCDLVAKPKGRGRGNKYGAQQAFRCAACGADAKDREAPCRACRGIDFLRFDSKVEARRYDVLRQRQNLGEIHGLTLQDRFPIRINGRKVSTYRADFSYYDLSGVHHVEDVKGRDTDASRLRRRAVEAQYGITIEIVR